MLFVSFLSTCSAETSDCKNAIGICARCNGYLFEVVDSDNVVLSGVQRYGCKLVDRAVNDSKIDKALGEDVKKAGIAMIQGLRKNKISEKDVLQCLVGVSGDSGVLSDFYAYVRNDENIKKFMNACREEQKTLSMSYKRKNKIPMNFDIVLTYDRVLFCRDRLGLDLTCEIGTGITKCKINEFRLQSCINGGVGLRVYWRGDVEYGLSVGLQFDVFRLKFGRYEKYLDLIKDFGVFGKVKRTNTCVSLVICPDVSIVWNNKLRVGLFMGLKRGLRRNVVKWETMKLRTDKRLGGMIGIKMQYLF